MMDLPLTYPYALPPLPYPYDALQPALDGKTLRIHHDKHFAAAIDQLNALLSAYSEYQSWHLSDLVTNWTDLPPAIRTDVRHAAGNVFCHDLYFRSMAAPAQRGQTSPALLAAIDTAFHTPAGFFRAFTTAARTAYGCGFLWLVCNKDGALHIVKTPNHEIPLPQIPLLCCDLWEHSYYLSYQNRKSEYLVNWMGLINWTAVSHRYADATHLLPQSTL